MSKVAKTVLFFDFGQIVAYNEDGEQIPEIQEKFWTGLVCERMEALGYNPSDTEFVLSNDIRKHFAKVNGTWRMI